MFLFPKLRLIGRVPSAGAQFNKTPTIISNHCSTGAYKKEKDLNNLALEEEYKSEIEDVKAKFLLKKEIKRSLVGIVVSDKNLKSVSIKVQRESYNSKYDKILSHTKKFMAHDEEEVASMGDLIRIVECRPMSKMKRHKVYEIIRKGKRLDLDSLSKEDQRNQDRFY